MPGDYSRFRFSQRQLIEHLRVGPWFGGLVLPLVAVWVSTTSSRGAVLIDDFRDPIPKGHSFIGITSAQTRLIVPGLFNEAIRTTSLSIAPYSGPGWRQTPLPTATLDVLPEHRYQLLFIAYQFPRMNLADLGDGLLFNFTLEEPYQGKSFIDIWPSDWELGYYTINIDSNEVFYPFDAMRREPHTLGFVFIGETGFKGTLNSVSIASAPSSVPEPPFAVSLGLIAAGLVRRSRCN